MSDSDDTNMSISAKDFLLIRWYKIPLAGPDKPAKRYCWRWKMSSAVCDLITDSTCSRFKIHRKRNSPAERRSVDSSSSAP